MTPVKALRKDDDITIRISRKLRRQLERASDLVSRERQVIIRPGGLARELIIAGVSQLLRQRGQAA